ncbi:MAG TPA: hypothetical protein VFK05_01280 [Polyangiaceae bacterium]|nr:hypothetical protein [Polyangiaceae bacterium]
MPPVTASAQLILLGNAYEPASAEQVFRALEAEPSLAPQRWGVEAGIRDPYDRSALVRSLVAYPFDVVPRVYRTQAPCKYSMEWFGGETLTTLCFDVRVDQETDDLPEFFAALSRFAALLPLDFGHITPEYRDQPKETKMKRSGNFSHLSYYETYGPSCLFPRTYFGARLVALMDSGAQRLAALHPRVKWLANGSAEVDLVPAPWSAEPAELKQAQQALQSALVASGIFCDPSLELDVVPGPRWRPPTPTAGNRF